MSFVASAVIDLLKQLKEKDEMSTYMVVDQVFFYWSFWALGSLMTSDFHSLIKITLVYILPPSQNKCFRKFQTQYSS